MTKLADLVVSVLEDGMVDDNEVGQLKDMILADGVIDREEADTLFYINDVVGKNPGNCSSWNSFFVDTVVNHLLYDETSPGVVDESEANWLVSKIESDGNIDDLEKSVCQALRNQAKKLPDSLVRKFEAWGV